MALKALNSVGGFSVGEVPSNVILANGDILTTKIDSGLNTLTITANGSTTTFQSNGQINIPDALVATGNVTAPWFIGNVFGNISGNIVVPGANTELLYNNNGNIGANANLTFNTASSLLTITGNANVSNLNSSGKVTASTLQSNVSTGTAPLTVSSTTLVSNLNADLLDGYNTATANTGNTVVVRDTSGNVSANYFIGDGSQLTGIGDAASIANGTSNVRIPTINGNINLSVNSNANILVVTDTGINVAGYINATGNANVGNIGATNANLSAATVTGNANVGNLGTGGLITATGNITGGNLNTGGKLSVTGNANVGNIGATQGIFVGNISAGNANLGNLAFANYINVSSNLFVTDTANVGNLRTDNLLYANGTPWDLGGNPGGSNTYVQYNDGAGNFGGSANFAFDYATNELSLNGNLLLGGTEQNQVINLSNTSLEIRGGWNASSSTGVALVAGDYSNSANWGKLAILGNYAGNSVGFAEANAFIFTTPGYGAGNIVKIDVLNNTATSTTTGAIQVSGGIGVTGNGYFGGNLSVTGNIANVNNISITNQLNGNVANFSGNLTASNANLGNLAQANYVNVSQQINGNVANFSGNLTAANADLGNLAIANYINVASAITVAPGGNINGGNLVTANFLTGTLTTAAQPNITSVGTLTGLVVNGTANVTDLNATANIIGSNIVANTGVQTPLVYNGTSNIAITQNGNVTLTANGNTIATVTGTGVNVSGYLTTTGNITAPYVIANVIGNISGNISAAGSNTQVQFNDGTLLGASANFTFDKVTNILTITGNIVGSNISTGGVVTATGNITGGNLNTSGRVQATGNVTGGNLTTTGLVSATGNVSGGNITTTGNVVANTNVVTDSVINRSGNLVLTASGSNSIVLSSGNVINANLTRIINVADPTAAGDAVNKEYVDNQIVSQLQIHTPVVVESPTALNATYAQGGVVQTITTIATGNTFTTGTTHNLSAGDVIVFDNTFNGVTAGTAYFIFSTPTGSTFTLTDSYYGAELSGFTNGTGLSQNARSNSGVGATLTNAGANVALQIDGVSLSVNDRVLVYQQANAAHNGVYYVSIVGDGSTAWELTRSPDEDKFVPKSTGGLGAGDYFFVQQGDTGAGESYVLTSPTGTIIFGTTNIVFTQFSAASVYKAGTGLTLSNLTFSISNTSVTANSYGSGDAVATFTVNGQGQLTAASNTPITANAANLTGTTLASTINSSNLTSVGTLTSLTVSGNVTAGNITGVFANGNSNISIPVSNGNVNISATGVANVVIVTSTGVNVAGTFNSSGNANVGNLGTGGLIVATGNITGGNLTTGGLVSAVGNVTGGNLTTGGVLSVTGNANVGNLGTGGLIVATGNITGGNLNTGGVLSVTGNANVGNLGTGGLITATGNITGGNVITGGLVSATGNVTGGNLTTTGVVTATGTITGGNLSTAGNITGNVYTANTLINIGNTSIRWANVVTSSISANQTIATFAVSGINGVEFFIKGVDSTGSKYSVATVQAITDGSSVDYVIFGTTFIGGTTGTLAVNIVGSNIELQVTPSSTNNTVWTTQFRTI